VLNLNLNNLMIYNIIIIVYEKGFSRYISHLYYNNIFKLLQNNFTQIAVLGFIKICILNSSINVTYEILCFKFYIFVTRN